jgi:enoyl-CoA hydratase
MSGEFALGASGERRGGPGIRWTTTGCVSLLALIAGRVSYRDMHLLVELHGQPGWVAALTPFLVTDDQWRAQHVLVERLIRAMLDCPVPVLAAVNGAAYGGGCELVLAADFGYAAENARFALPETGLGIMPGAGGTQHLPRAAGLRRAKEIIFTARSFGAADALRWQIVNEVVPAAELHGHALDTAAAIAANAPLAVRQAKRAMQLGLEMDRRTGLFFEAEAYSRLVPTRDRLEGIQAYTEHRTPALEGR